MEKTLLANSNKKRAVVAILISEKIDSKPKTILRHKEENYIMIKGSSHYEHISSTSIYAQSPKRYEANIGRIEGRNRQFYNNSLRILHSMFNRCPLFPIADYVNSPTFSIRILPTFLLLSLRNVPFSYHIFVNCPVFLVLLISFISL